MPRILFVAVGDTALGQVVRGHLKRDTISRQYANAVAAEFAGEMRQDQTFRVELDAEKPTGEFFDHSSGHFNAIFFTHLPPRCVNWRTCDVHGTRAITV